jgi:predicted 2-oxoglutarate/Fe(II)-dependent dioxygenase YbiX
MSVDPIRRCLLSMSGNGRFVARHTLGAAGLQLTVDGVGPLRLPPTDEQLARLRAVARPSPFGFRDQTLHDEQVRRAWEVPGDEVHLDAETWPARLSRAIDHLRRGLGLPDGLLLSPQLHKLVLYGEGDFFVPHRDTERDATLWASLVVVLPCAHEGGELVVRHAGEEERFDTGPDSRGRQLDFVAFYPDCVHEVRPVRQGCRLALTFGLHAAGGAPRPQGPPAGQLASVLARHFADEDVLVVLLDHAYTEQRLSLDLLKGLDRARVDALVASAEHPDVDAVCLLATAKVRDEFEYTDDEASFGTREGFGAWQATELSLASWRRLDGAPVRGDDIGLGDEAIVSTLPPLERSVTTAEGHPWTGNEGGTAEQWYHQAALVMLRRGAPGVDQMLQSVDAAPQRRRVVRRRRG